MYQALDSYAKVETWYTLHPNDQTRFYTALSKIVRNPNFSPEEMGSYLREKFGVDEDAEDHFSKAIDSLVTRAWAVKDYLRASGE